jgi:metal-responsive CopG/Arc/MetJ family transcriptional regulator
MGKAVKRTISLPPDLAEEIDEISRSEGKSVSAIVQDALRLARSERLKQRLRDVQGYWSQKAREKGVLTQKDLDRLIGK